MNIATIAVSGVQSITETCAVIPAGIVGATVTIRFTDPRWEGLTKIAVFQGCETRDVTMTGETVRIPHETVAQPDHTLRVGIYGVDTRQNLVIPTLWATVGVTREAADPSGDESLEPTPAVWEQIAQRMTELETEVKTLKEESQGVKAHLITILQSGLYAEDRSAEIQALAETLGITSEAQQEGE